jgi:hypothetical protein
MPEGFRAGQTNGTNGTNETNETNETNRTVFYSPNTSCML